MLLFLKVASKYGVLCLSAGLLVCQPACQFACQSFCLPVDLSACLSVRLPTYLPVHYLTACLPACLFACLSALDNQRLLDQQPCPSINITNQRWASEIKVRTSAILRTIKSIAELQTKKSHRTAIADLQNLTSAIFSSFLPVPLLSSPYFLSSGWF